jgi:hypothetical protein
MTQMMDEIALSRKRGADAGTKIRPDPGDPI